VTFVPATRFIFVEGMIGCGKTTTCEFIANELQRRGVAARAISEGGEDHVLRIALELAHPNAVWRDTTPADFAARSIRAWQRFVCEVEPSPAVTVCDGLLFHGNLTDLMMMDADPEMLYRSATQILKTLAPLQPTVAYLYQSDVAQALHTICDTRGRDWEAYQVNWKTSSPYALQRSLHGFDGLVQLYQAYRALCDAIFAQLSVPKLSLLNDGDWHDAYSRIRRWLTDIEQSTPGSWASD